MTGWSHDQPVHTPISWPLLTFEVKHTSTQSTGWQERQEKATAELQDSSHDLAVARTTASRTSQGSVLNHLMGFNTEGKRQPYSLRWAFKPFPWNWFIILQTTALTKCSTLTQLTINNKTRAQAHNTCVILSQVLIPFTQQMYNIITICQKYHRLTHSLFQKRLGNKFPQGYNHLHTKYIRITALYIKLYWNETAVSAS